MELGQALLRIFKFFWHGLAPPGQHEYETDAHYFWRVGITAYMYAGGILVGWHITRAAGFWAWLGIAALPGYANAEDVDAVNDNINSKTHEIQKSVDETNRRLDSIEGAILISAIGSLRNDYCEAVRMNEVALAESIYAQIESLQQDYFAAMHQWYNIRECLL